MNRIRNAVVQCSTRAVTVYAGIILAWLSALSKTAVVMSPDMVLSLSWAKSPLRT